MALSKKAKVGVAVGTVLGLGLIVGVAAASSGKRNKRKPAEEPIDLDALPEPEPSPSAVTSDVPPVVVSPSTPHDDDEQTQSSPGTFPDITPGDVAMPPLVVTSAPATSEPPIMVSTHPSIPSPVPVAVPAIDVPQVLTDLSHSIPQAPIPVSVPLPTVPPVAAAPLADAMTLAMVAELRAAERSAGWKRSYPSVERWQAAHGRTVDGKFGPGDALVLATISGDVPVIRYWPLKDGPNPKRAVDDYRQALMTIAAAKPALAVALQHSASIERGQSFGPPQGDGGKAPVVV